jgi:glycosyltransferase involved in cell wall biosynthesis
MKIVARVHAYPPFTNAGAEMMLHALLRALVERGHDCSVYLIERCGHQTPYLWEGIYVVPRGAFDDEKAIKHADVAISHLQASAHTQRIADRHRTPTVYLVHNDFEDTTRRELARTPASLTVFNSQAMADSLADLTEGIVVYPPVDPEEYRVEPGESVTLINMTDIKGVDVFWKLAAELPDIPFLGVEGGYGYQETQGGLPNVTIMGHSPNIRRAYAETKILLMPSKYDTWGRVTVEAMSSGIPVIASPCPGVVEALGGAGFVIERDNLDAWASTIRTLIDDPAAYAKASAAARQRALDLDPADDLARFCDAVEALA